MGSISKTCLKTKWAVGLWSARLPGRRQPSVSAPPRAQQMPTRHALPACRLRELETGSARTRRPVVGDGTRSRLFRLPEPLGSFRARKSFSLEPRDVIWAERGRKLKPLLRSQVPGRDVAGRAGSSWARAGRPTRAVGAQPACCEPPRAGPSLPLRFQRCALWVSLPWGPGQRQV